MMEQNLTRDVENRTSTTSTPKRKLSLGLIIALILAIVATIAFCSVFIIYQQKYVKARASLDAKEKQLEDAMKITAANATRLLEVKGLAMEMTNTDISLAPLSEPVLMKREMIGSDKLGNLEAQKSDFKVMQFNILADGLCGLYDPGNPDVQHFKTAMEEANQHYLYWRYRLPLIVAEIIDNGADIITIQENDHPKSIQEALNIRAEAKNMKALWVCIDQQKSKSPIQTLAELPAKNNKSDGSSICWNSDKFTQNSDFEIKKMNYPVYTQTISRNAKIDVGNGDVYLAVKLTQKDTGKDVIIVTTRLESKKTLGGEEIRMHQIEHLMKQMAQWKKENDKIPIIFTGDLNAMPKENKNAFKNPKADTLLEMKDLNGTYFCQMKDIVSAIEVQDKEFKIISIWPPANSKNDDLIPNNVLKIHDNLELNLFELKINNDYYFLDKEGKSNVWKKFRDVDGEMKCQRRSHDNLEKPNSVITEEFNLVKNIFGQTFYDSYNVKYEIEDFNPTSENSEPIDGDYKITINSFERIMKYDSSSKTFTIDLDDGQVCTLDLNDGSYMWKCTSNEKVVWSKNPFNILQVNYPAAVYNYINSPKTILSPTEFEDLKNTIINDSKNQGYISMVKSVEYLEHYEGVIDVAIVKMMRAHEDVRQPSIDLGFQSSQKILNKGNEEPNCTLLKETQQIFPVEGDKKVTRSTVDYIFNTSEIEPVAYLSYPYDSKYDSEFTDSLPTTDVDVNLQQSTQSIINKGYLPNYNYPSDHFAIATQFRFKP